MMQSPSCDLAVMPPNPRDSAARIVAMPGEAMNPVDLDGASETEGIYGACSAESYRAAGALHAAHRDTGGFLDAVDRFSTPDFWRRDGAVRSSIYSGAAQEAGDEPGLDAVRVFYHSGHGCMDENGQFRLPMGALWNGTDASIGSQDMRLGADRLRYLFWSASESLRLREGHSPVRSWALANAGLRMMFGFESVCWDSERQGAGFWQHWRLGKSFSQSWLDAAAEVSTEQIASVCAVGATREEALARLFGERRFAAPKGDPAWWVWRWTQSLAQHRRDPITEIPAGARNLRLLHPDDDLAGAWGAFQQAGIAALPDRLGEMRIRVGRTEFVRSAQGNLLVEFARASRGSRDTLPLHRRALVARASSALRRHAILPPGIEVCFDRILLSMSAGLGLRKAENLPQAVDELSVQFRQCVGTIPFIAPQAGWVRVVMQSDGSLLRIESRLRGLAGAPGAAGKAEEGGGRKARPQPDIIDLLARRSAQLLRDLAARGAAPLTLRVLPGLTEIGYGIRSNTARLIARQGVEITCVRGFRKRYWIQSDLGD